MIKIVSMLAAAALVGVPLAAQAQDHDGYGYRDGYARPAAGYGHDAGARVYGARHNDVSYGRAGRAGRFGRDRFDRGRSYYRYGDNRRWRGDVAVGFGWYRGYSGGGSYDAGAYPAGGYGADYAYSYPDQYGTYQPFAYDYSDRDDAYYADGGPGDGGPGDDGPGYSGDGRYDSGPAYGGGYQAGPNVGWSPGGPPADCGQWVWREDRGAYQWIPAPCPR